MLLKFFLLKGTPWDLPRGPLVKTPHFHCRGHWVWSLFRELRPCMFHGMAKKIFLVINKRESSVENIGLGDLWAWERLRQGPASDTASDVPEDRPSKGQANDFCWRVRCWSKEKLLEARLRMHCCVRPDNQPRHSRTWPLCGRKGRGGRAGCDQRTRWSHSREERIRGVGEGSHSTGGLQDPRRWFFNMDKTVENCVE